MKQQDKELLLKDLCARLPYHVIVEYRGANVDLTQYARSVKIENCRPYLRPLSSMTNEEKAELKAITNEFGDNWFEATTPEERWKCTFLNSSNEIDWLNAHHFDYRGLIEKGLAIEAPEGMYNLNNE